MRECVGLSVGATNLVAARIDGTSTVRPASVPWRGSALTGFVERVGDPVPIIASDGSAHHADTLMMAALGDLIRTAGRPGEPVGIALPAHWHQHVVGRVRNLLPGSTVGSDAVAALTALRAHPGLPSSGVVLLCDFGATGTSVTLADAAAEFETIGATARVDDFSGEAIDQSVLAYLLAGLDVDPAGTSAVASLSGFRANCRIAKERLSFESATGLPGPRPGTTVRLTRAELESLVRGPLDAVLVAIDDLLTRHHIRRSDLVAVASVGGGSRIPVVTQRLSEALRMPVTTTPHAQTVAAIGAALIAGREPETLTRVAVAARLASVPVAPRPQAWSTAEVAEPVEFTEFTHDPDRARPDVHFVPGDPDDAAPLEPLAWYRRPAVLFAGAACAAILAATGLVLTTEVEAVGSASPTATAPASSVISAAPSEAAAAPSTATVVVTPPPSVVRYTPVPQAPVPAPQAQPVPQTQPVPQAPPAPVTTTATPTPTTTIPTQPPTTTPPPTTPPTTAPPPTTPPTTTTTLPPPPFTLPPLPTFTVPPIFAPTEPGQPITAGGTAFGSR